MKELSKKENVISYIGVAAMIVGLFVVPFMVDSGLMKFNSVGVYGIASCLLGLCSAFIVCSIAGIQIGTGRLIAYNDLKPGEYTLAGQCFYQNSDKPCILEVYQKESALRKKMFKSKTKKRFIGELPDSFPTMALATRFEIQAVPKKITPAHKLVKVIK